MGTMLLADLGADVVKIEPPGGESSRYRQAEDTVLSSGFVASNRSKRSLVLDLKKPAAQEVLRRLVASADIFVTNYRPGARAGLGMDYARLAELNPRLVYCSLTGYGERGPAAKKPAFDTVAQGRAGLLSVVLREEDYGRPLHMGMYVPDAVTGVYGMLAVLAALRARDETGRGQLVETSLLQSGVFFLNVNFMRYLDQLRRGAARRVTGLRSGGFVFMSKDEKPFVIHVPPAPPKHWVALVAAIEHPQLASDPRFEKRQAREQNYEVLDSVLRPVFAAKTRDQWFAIFDEYDIAYAPLNNLAEALDDPYVKDLEVLGEVVSSDGQAMQVLNPPFSLGTTPVRVSPPPLPGEHSREILLELGYSGGEVDRLLAERTITA
jgi:crotonobetainyl-CoA:carnitine CoA-transferase CaiB-like acyl-CoA transferase